MLETQLVWIGSNLFCVWGFYPHGVILKSPFWTCSKKLKVLLELLDAYGLEALGEDVSTLNIKPSWHPSNFPLMQCPIVVLDVWVICNHQMWHECHVIYVHVFDHLDVAQNLQNFEQTKSC